MSQNDPRSGSDDAALSRRLDSLGAGLRKVETRKGDVDETAGQSPAMSGIGQAMRLSTEFIAGIIVGAGAGWALDRWLGTAPWGMIVLLLLGTCAGFFNVARSAGLMKSRTSDKSGPK
jgi:ATP synthase protein I